LKEAIMEKALKEPRSLIFFTWLYQALLAVYPSEFRNAYGGPMLQLFRDSSRRALQEAGAGGLLVLWIRTMTAVSTPAACPSTGTPIQSSIR
jgi:hypothetical protein